MLAKYIGLPLIGAAFASAWWAWGVFAAPHVPENKDCTLCLMPLVIVSVVVVILSVFLAVADINRDNE